MADAAVPDATLAWAQGDTTGTCKAVNAKDLKAELVKAGAKLADDVMVTLRVGLLLRRPLGDLLKSDKYGGDDGTPLPSEWKVELSIPKVESRVLMYASKGAKNTPVQVAAPVSPKSLAEALVNDKFAASEDELEGIMLCFDGAEVPLLEAVKAGATEQLVALFQGGDKEPTTAQEIRIRIPVPEVEATFADQLVQHGWAFVLTHLRELMTKYTWDQVTLASALKISPSTVSQIVNGEYIVQRIRRNGSTMTRADATAWEKHFKDAAVYAAGSGTATLGAEEKKKRRARFPFKKAEVATGQTVDAYLQSCFEAQSGNFSDEFYKAVIDQVNDALRVRHAGQAGELLILDKDRLEDWRARSGWTAAKRARTSGAAADEEEAEQARQDHLDPTPETIVPVPFVVVTPDAEGAAAGGGAQ